MENKDLLKFCRYYKGEKEYPTSLSKKTTDMAFLFWEAEKKFVEDDADFGTSVLRQYFDAGLVGANLDLPLLLSAHLFAVYNHRSDSDLYASAAHFAEYFLPAYLGLTVM